MIASQRHFGCSLLLLIGALVLSGCDSGVSKRASRAQQLSGEWDVQCVYVGGGCDPVDAHIKFSEGEQKTFRIRREKDGETFEGNADLFSSNGLGMTGGFLSGPLVWRLDFSKPDPLPDSVRLILESDRNDAVRDFLNALGRTATTGPVEVDLVPPSS